MSDGIITGEEAGNPAAADFGPLAGDTIYDPANSSISGEIPLEDLSFKFGDLSIDSLTIGFNGYIIEGSCSSQALEPSDFDDSTQVMIAGGMMSYTNPGVADEFKNKIYFRLVDDNGQTEELNSCVDDDHFKADAAFVVTWYKVGDLANNSTFTNTFQVIIACDFDYNDTGFPRCFLAFIFMEMNYVETVADFIRVGINGPENGKLLSYFLITFNNFQQRRVS